MTQLIFNLQLEEIIPFRVEPEPRKIPPFRPKIEWYQRKLPFMIDTHRVPQDVRIKREVKHDYDEVSNFEEGVNSRANFFKMVSTGSASMDAKRMRSWSDPPKNVSTRYRVNMYCGHAFRDVEYEHVGSKVRLILTYLVPREAEVGEDIARIEDNKLRLLKLSSVPVESTYVEIEGMESQIVPKETVKTHVQKHTVKRKHVGQGRVIDRNDYKERYSD